MNLTQILTLCLTTLALTACVNNSSPSGKGNGNGAGNFNQQGDNTIMGSWIGKEGTLQDGTPVYLMLDIGNGQIQVGRLCVVGTQGVNPKVTVQAQITDTHIQLAQGGQQQERLPNGGICPLEFQAGAVPYTLQNGTLTVTLPNGPVALQRRQEQ